MMVNTSMKPFFLFLKKWNSDHEIAYPLPPSEKYFTSLASMHFWDGPLPNEQGGWVGGWVGGGGEPQVSRLNPHSAGLYPWLS